MAIFGDIIENPIEEIKEDTQDVKEDAVEILESGTEAVDSLLEGDFSGALDAGKDVLSAGLDAAGNIIKHAPGVAFMRYTPIGIAGKFIGEKLGILGDDNEEKNDGEEAATADGSSNDKSETSGYYVDANGMIQGLISGNINSVIDSITAGGIDDANGSNYSNEPTPMYYLPGYGIQINKGDEQAGGVFSSSPLLWSYSPRLFGAPPQLSNYCDMRLKSSKDGVTPGPVGDFYLNDILMDAQVANIIVGKAVFTGGTNNMANIARVAGQYIYAMSKYGLLGEKDTTANDRGIAGALSKYRNMEAYKKIISEGGDAAFETTVAKGFKDIDDGTTIAVLDGDAGALIGELSSLVKGGAAIAAPLLTSLSVQQPFYSFDADWHSHMNNVKMMINTAVIMLGLQKACVRIGDYLWPIGMHAKFHDETDVWSNYRFITPTEGLGTVNQIDQMNGNTTQYVSFMIDQFQMTEHYANNVGESQLYTSAISKGNDYGNEISFLASTNFSKLDDAVIDMATSAREQAEAVLTKLSKSTGRFTAAIAGSMARSYVGDHTIYPDIFTGHRANEGSCSFTVHLNASSGDPYSYLIEVLVPLFHLMAMGIPKMSQNNASAYTYPPMVQVNIPGMWGCRMGMVTSIDVQKNPNQRDYSIHGFPLSVNVTVNIADLEHVLMSSPMDKPSVFLNNTTMFDYIAQCAGVDKYRVNGSVRLVTRMALTVSAVNNSFNNLGDAILSDWTGYVNKMTGLYRDI